MVGLLNLLPVMLEAAACEDGSEDAPEKMVPKSPSSQAAKGPRRKVRNSGDKTWPTLFYESTNALLGEGDFRGSHGNVEVIFNDANEYSYRAVFDDWKELLGTESEPCGEAARIPLAVFDDTDRLLEAKDPSCVFDDSSWLSKPHSPSCVFDDTSWLLEKTSHHPLASLDNTEVLLGNALEPGRSRNVEVIGNFAEVHPYAVFDDLKELPDATCHPVTTFDGTDRLLKSTHPVTVFNDTEVLLGTELEPGGSRNVEVIGSLANAVPYAIFDDLKELFWTESEPGGGCSKSHMVFDSTDQLLEAEVWPGVAFGNTSRLLEETEHPCAAAFDHTCCLSPRGSGSVCSPKTEHYIAVFDDTETLLGGELEHGGSRNVEVIGSFATAIPYAVFDDSKELLGTESEPGGKCADSPHVVFDTLDEAEVWSGEAFAGSGEARRLRFMVFDSTGHLLGASPITGSRNTDGVIHLDAHRLMHSSSVNTADRDSNAKCPKTTRPGKGKGSSSRNAALVRGAVADHFSDNGTPPWQTRVGGPAGLLKDPGGFNIQVPSRILGVDNIGARITVEVFFDGDGRVAGAAGGPHQGMGLMMPAARTDSVWLEPSRSKPPSELAPI